MSISFPVIQRIIEDTRCKEVAVALGICVKSTEIRRSNILRKLEMHSSPNWSANLKVQHTADGVQPLTCLSFPNSVIYGLPVQNLKKSPEEDIEHVRK
jgi:hypothetical protein